MGERSSSFGSFNKCYSPSQLIPDKFSGPCIYFMYYTDIL
jgi:hypothetical protein